MTGIIFYYNKVTLMKNNYDDYNHNNNIQKYILRFIFFIY